MKQKMQQMVGGSIVANYKVTWFMNAPCVVDTDYDHWAISYLFKDSNARISPLFSATLITFCKPILALLRYLSTKCKLILNTFSYKPMILQNLIRFLPTNKLEFYLDRK